MSTVSRSAAVYAATFAVFVALDAAWLMLAGFEMFQNQLGAILRPEPLLGAVIAFYPIYVFGLVMLAVQPALDAGTWTAAAAKGAVLGLTAYATFDLTNLAVITGWTLGLAATDIAWGVLVSTAASVAGYAAGTRGASVAALSPSRER